MTPEAQRRAIAEACPFVTNRLSPSIFIWDSPVAGRCQFDPLNDLNAMHEAEKILGLNQCDSFEEHLQQIAAHDSILRRQHGEMDARVAELFGWHATAAQRAESFLRVLMLWKD